MFQPNEDRVLIKRTQVADKVGSLYVPTNAKEKPSTGVVVAVGEGRMLDNGQRHTTKLEPGMSVIFGKYSGDEITVDGEPHIVMRPNDVLGWSL